MSSNFTSDHKQKCPSPDTSTSRLRTGIKRRHPESETDSYSDATTESVNNGNSHSEREDSAACSESSSRLSSGISRAEIQNIPTNTSEWTDEVFPVLQIEVEKSTRDAYYVFLDGYLSFVDQSKSSDIVYSLQSRSENDKDKVEYYKYAVTHALDIDYNHIDDITFDKLNEMEKKLNSNWFDKFVLERTDRGQRKLSASTKDLERAGEHLKLFMWQLFLLVRKRQGKVKKEITKGNFQQLFTSFVKIFCLNIVSSCNVDKYTKTIDEGNMNHKIIAIPDALITHPTTIEDKICAIVQVKKYKHCNSDQAIEYVGNLQSSQKTSINVADHIDSELRGQHSGQFLCLLPSSMFGDHGMFGFLVQGTNVTVTSFKPEIGYCENLCKMNSHKKGAVMSYSREYNILRKEGRLELVETLFDMGKLMEYLCQRKFTSSR